VRRIAEATLFTLVLCATASARDLPKGLGTNEADEKELAASIDKLTGMLRKEKPDYKMMAGEISAARTAALRIDAQARELRYPALPDTPKVTKPSDVVVYAGTKADHVLKLWREQLDFYLRSARGLLDGDAKYLREWTGRRGFRKPERRIGSMIETLREAAKMVRLLAQEKKTIPVRKGELLFADDFSKGADHWLPYGQCVTSHQGDAFRMKDERVPHPDAMMWTKRQFDGDFLAEFTFIPHTKGTRAGALFTICGTPRKGKTLAVCVGRTMNTYNYGINGYHFSMHRGTTGLGNVRRVGPGLKLLVSGQDPCPTPGKSYRVAIGKVGPTIFLVVDGTLIHSYTDAATHSPVLTRGHIGIRHWAGLDASYKDFRVFRLVPKQVAGR
jgi:hypothetical protein